MIAYDLDKLKQLLYDFYNLTQMKICIYDQTETEICYYPEKLTEFCKLLRQDREMEGRCLECDRRAFARCKQTHRQYVYTCHIGLTECVSPVIYNDSIIGYIVLGQVKTSSGDEEGKQFDGSAAREAELERTYAKLPAFSPDKINSAIHVLDACTGYEYLKRLITTVQVKIDVLVGAYIDEHISESLSVTDLCTHFHLSKSELYAIFSRYFNAAPAEFIKARRLNKACALLTETTLQVNKIAIKCGIPDYNYFSKVFKKAYGICPREVRKK